MENVDQIKRPLEGVYLIDQEATYNAPNPTPLDNLLAMYDLELIASSLGRTKPDGSKGVKLRKSYKNHIQDLKGKHQIPPSKPLNGQILDPELAKIPDVITEFNPELLSAALKFDKTSINGIPGFSPSDLALSDQAASTRGDDNGESEEAKRKRKKKQLMGVEYKRHHI
ncbi:hypothetical protein METBIDRAFT_9914 [Metschnikowia bicuspidata var. bicuspidata NRRL YB-4993]|uniref:Mediator of RNA polymerase II transcription subunit 19 n=1 Tax=Metschnikowia bicuspidata var. bicuspidata NRRL YB-4993 TaxID=869754 RepID=A0A1A0HIF7_9ASCO|nr:hypothetical protein METBIDRAFT_9914 [Metschnikowia bicuspidata var. bicuspidata NRRL YB-4993]OBA23667.1 hypothetical protein METBIDRAFT_9914 [Metschnikowia bicuspidata var. bicuspidata NRRL YB-4993]